jgi:hypothetical protein
MNRFLFSYPNNDKAGNEMPQQKFTSGPERNTVFKKILLLSLTTLSLSFISASAFACVPGEPDCNDTFKNHVMVTTDFHSKIEQPTDPVYGMLEGSYVPAYMLETDIPQLWLELPWIGRGRTSQVIAKWYSLDLLDSNGDPTLLLTQTQTGNSRNRNFWFSPTEWITKDDGSKGLRNAGVHWKVDSYYEWRYYGRLEKIGCATNSFVTPEPVSLVLFSLGAGILGLTKLRRKKK